MKTQEIKMGMNGPKDGKAGTTDQSLRWEGPQDNRPRGYLPAEDNPDIDRDAKGENLSDPVKRNLGDAMKTSDDDAQ